MIAFEWPLAFALAILPFLVWRLLPEAGVTGAVALPIADELLAASGPRSSRFGRGLALPAAAWALLVLAAAQPTWTGRPVPLPVHARDLVLAVDLSGSMGERDVDRRHQKTRLEAVHEAAAEFLQRRTGDRIGLVVFGTSAHVYAPLTLDHAAVASMLARTEVGLAGVATAIGDAIVAGMRALGGSTSERVIVLLTDGENTAGSVLPARAAEMAAAAGIRIHAIGFGAEVDGDPVAEILGLQAAPVQTAPLRRIAESTGGRYFRARDEAQLRGIYAQIDQLEPALVDQRTFVPSRTLFHWPLAAALLLALVFVVRRRMLP